MKKRLLIFTSIALTALVNRAQVVSDFENLRLSDDSYWAGTASSGDSTFSSGDANFPNTYNSQWSYWEDGWAYSNVADSVTSGSANQYASRAGSGYGQSSNYAVGKNGAKIILTGEDDDKALDGVYLTNSTYATISMENGDNFAKKFGGESGNDSDWFLLTIKGYRDGNMTTDSVNFYLADFRSDDNSLDYIVKDWKWVDLKPLGGVDSLEFSLNSSDVGQFGMNTPAYFCFDNLRTAGSALAVNQFQQVATQVYPNPTSGLLHVSNASAGTLLSIVDLSGKLVKQGVAGENLTTFDVSDFHPGIYVLNLINDGVVSVYKFIKE